jgi:hypothetical protein
MTRTALKEVDMEACFKVVFDCNGDFIRVEPVGDRALRIDGAPISENPIDNVRKIEQFDVLMGTIPEEHNTKMMRCCIVYYKNQYYCVPCGAGHEHA